MNVAAKWALILAALRSAAALSQPHPIHTNNWAVIVNTSKFWFNYRHAANALTLYRLLKQRNIPDSQIILMLADDIACNARNVYPASIFNDDQQRVNVYGEDVEVDYRGNEVTVETFIRVLTETPRSKRLATNERSNIFIYMTGHGGDNFLKFQDTEEINAHDLADAIAQMEEKKRYNEIFLIVDTCQAATMYEKISSKNVLAAASSIRGESSYSHSIDTDLGVAVIDRFTNLLMTFFEDIRPDATMQDMIESWEPLWLGSTPGVRTDLMRRDPSTILITEFFGNVQNVEHTPVLSKDAPTAITGRKLFSKDAAPKPGKTTAHLPRNHYDISAQDGVKGAGFTWRFYIRLAAISAALVLLRNF